MNLIINNREEILEGESLTIREILTLKNFTFPRVVIKINGKLIRKPEYDTTRVANGDNLEIIHLISGG